MKIRLQNIESHLESWVKHPEDSEEVLSVKKIWTAGVIAVSVAIAFLTSLTFLLKLRLLTYYGLALISMYLICLGLFLILKRHNRIFFYLTQLSVILITFIFVLLLGGVLHSGGIMFAALASVVFSLVYPRPHLALSTFLLYAAAVITAGILQPYLDPVPELSPLLNILFTVINSLWIAGFILFVIFYVFAEKAKTETGKAQRLLELDRMKTRLYHNISHEFRTPLTLIMGIAARFEDREGLGSKEEAGVIYQNGQKLLSLVNQILDLSQLEAGIVQVKMVQSDIIKKLRFITQSFESLAQIKNIRLHFLPATTHWIIDYDECKLEKMLGNLITNAVKFTPPGGDVYVSVANASEQLLITVRDNGVGIAPEDLPRIFEPFYQSPQLANNNLQHGTGLGLTLVKEFTELLGGSVTVDSQPGSGATFSILLPVTHNAPIEEPVNTATSPPTENEKKHLPVSPTDSTATDTAPLILLIEDNPDMVAFIETLLRPYYRVSWSANGLAGLEAAYATIPDIVISDVMLPGVDGYEVCQTLKSDYRTNHIPVLLLTARADLDSKLTGFEKGADAYITKPFSEKELLIRIKNLLDLRLKLHQHYDSRAGLFDNIKEVSTPAIEDPFVASVRKIIHNHLDDYNFGVEDLCHEINMSHSQLHRKLIALTGIAAVKFVRHVRLERALELLLDPSWNITAIALETGFQDPSYFGRVFKQEFGLTPLEWREKQMHGHHS